MPFSCPPLLRGYMNIDIDKLSTPALIWLYLQLSTPEERERLSDIEDYFSESEKKEFRMLMDDI